MMGEHKSMKKTKSPNIERKQEATKETGAENKEKQKANTKPEPNPSDSSLKIADAATPREKWQALRRSTKDLIQMSSSSVKLNGNANKDSTKSESQNGADISNVKNDAPPNSEEQDLKSGALSARSEDSKKSTIDLSGVPQASVIPTKSEEEGNKGGYTDDSYIRSVIPYLPLPLAIPCLMLNMVLPGSGTMLSGFAIICCGRPRVESKEGHKNITFCVNVLVGVMQLFTVPFMLVGWFWSFVWGIYLVILAVEYSREDKQLREKEMKAKALTALNANLRPWTLMRS